MISRITDPLVSLIYPQLCRSCGHAVERADDGPACRDCWGSNRILGDSDPLCGKCGRLFERSTKEFSIECGKCRDHHYDRAVSAGVYEKALRASILALKHEPYLSRTAAGHLFDAFDRIECFDPLIIPVPLSRQRLHERGFNQAAVLAKAVSRHAGLALDDQSLVRIHDTPMHRAAMDVKARDRTVAGAFAVKRPRLIEGRDILLIDDLMTSGATVSHCARVLKKNGAGEVIVLTLARAISN